MDQKKALPISIALGLALQFFSACAQSAPAPATAVALNPTPTAIPPTDTPIPVPPTDTPVPPTDTPTPSNTPTSTSTPSLALTATPVSPTDTPVPPTRTRVPPTAVPRPTLAPTVASLLKVDWKTGIEYIPRDGTSNWCQMHNQYHNNSTVDISFQTGGFVGIGTRPPSTYSGYDPVFGIANPDGAINAWRVGGWYSQLFGWPNGIPGFPADIKAGTTSDDWTWYSDAQTNGEYCRYVYVKVKGQISAAEYSPKGDLINTNATLPPGAP